VPDLSFHVDGAEAAPYSAAPLLNFKLQIANQPAHEVIQSTILRCQIQIEPAKRQYASQEKGRLLDLFGETQRWGTTLKPLLWTNTSVVVPSFTGSTLVDLPVPCTFDFNVATTKYFHALEDGEVPVQFLFSGTVFHTTRARGLQVAQIPWDREAKYRLPIQVWKRMMDSYYPNIAWLQLRRDVFDRLYEYKVQHGIPTWEQVIEELLPAMERRATS
jgi:Family of unknown function (DUF6084)